MFFQKNFIIRKIYTKIRPMLNEYHGLDRDRSDHLDPFRLHKVNKDY